MLCTALVLAAHALLILGLPHWGTTGRPGLATGTLVTRIVGPKTPEPAQEAAQPAPPAPPQPKTETPPEPPAPPKPSKPEPAPERPAVPKKPRPTTAPAEPKPATSDTSVPKPPAAGGAAGTPGNGADQEPSILAGPPPPQFAPFPPVTPIAIRPTDEDNRQIRASIKSAGDAPAQVPHPAEVIYKSVGTIGGIPIDMPSRLTWRHDGTYYESKWIIYHVKAGEQSLYSDGLVTPQGLAPLNAMYRTKGDQKMNFDHAGERLLAAPKTPPRSLKPQETASAPQTQDTPVIQEIKMPPGTQDRLSLIMQLAALLAGEPGRYPVGTTITLPVAIQNPPSVLEWSFVVGEEEVVPGMINGKPLKTIHLTHESTGETDTRMELWLAPALEYLPARIRTVEANGDTVDYAVHQAFGTDVIRSLPDSPR